MPFAFNQELWNIGRKIEDTALPYLNKHYGCDFKRNYYRRTRIIIDLFI